MTEEETLAGPQELPDLIRDFFEMAKAYPKSQFHGYDISSHALARAEANRREAGVENAHFHHAAADPLPTSGQAPAAARLAFNQRRRSSFRIIRTRLHGYGAHQPSCGAS